MDHPASTCCHRNPCRYRTLACGCNYADILNNPLATPYTLGVSSGAGLGAYLAIVIGVEAFAVLGRYLLPVFAFVFALAACLSIYAIAKARNFTSSIMLLAGIGMNFLFSAAQTLLQYAASAEELQTAMFWLFGSLNRSKWEDLAILFPVIVVCFIYIYRNSWKLTAMQLGDAKAKTLGIPVEKLRMRMFIVISLLTATAVAFVGTIGFIGLVGPHIARMLVGEDQRYFIPMSCTCGALILFRCRIGRPYHRAGHHFADWCSYLSAWCSVLLPADSQKEEGDSECLK